MAKEHLIKIKGNGRINNMHYNKPYKLTYDLSSPKKVRCLYDYQNRKTDIHIFLGGLHLPSQDVGKMRYSQDPNTYDLIYTINVEKDRILKYDYLPAYVPHPIVNSKVLAILEDICPNDFQAFPAVIESIPNNKHPFEIHNVYWTINISKSINAIDLNKSDLDLDCYGEMESWRKLEFKSNILTNNVIHLAREKIFPPLILASPQLKEAFEKYKIKGCEFLTDEEYNRLSF